MKRLLFILIILLAASCSKEEEKNIEVSNIEAFAFQLDSGWELNSSVIIKNFAVQESADKYNSKLSYYVNLTQPDSSVVEEADYGLIDISESEEINEYQLNIQIELDSAFEAGNYKMILIVMDDLNGKQDTVAADFELTLE